MKHESRYYAPWVSLALEENAISPGIDLSVVSLTCPNVYWGGEKVSLKRVRGQNALRVFSF